MGKIIKYECDFCDEMIEDDDPVVVVTGLDMEEACLHEECADRAGHLLGVLGYVLERGQMDDEGVERRRAYLAPLKQGHTAVFLNMVVSAAKRGLGEENPKEDHYTRKAITDIMHALYGGK